jgi:hypothetical protein
MTSDDWVEGKVNGGLEFDGVDDYVDVGGSDYFNFSDNMTFSVWAKFPSYDWANIVGKHMTDSTTSYSYGFRISTTAIMLDTYMVDGTRVNPSASSENYPANNWYHILGSYDGANLNFYINGELLSSEFNTSGLYSSWGKNLYIGKTGGYGYWEGQIDDVQIYNYALTAEQVKEVYNGGAVRFR